MLYLGYSVTAVWTLNAFNVLSTVHLFFLLCHYLSYVTIVAFIDMNHISSTWDISQAPQGFCCPSLPRVPGSTEIWLCPICSQLEHKKALHKKASCSCTPEFARDPLHLDFRMNEELRTWSSKSYLLALSWSFCPTLLHVEHPMVLQEESRDRGKLFNKLFSTLSLPGHS